MTILKSFARSANFRRVVGRTDCSPFLLEFQRLFNKAFGSGTYRPETNNELPPTSNKNTHAYYMYHGITYSRAQTHLGNSLVRYVCAESQTSFVGSIEEIKTVGHEVMFEIQQHQPLPSEEDDPFRDYPWFPASSLSASMASRVDTVSPRNVLCHVARFHYGDNRIVAVDLCRVCIYDLLFANILINVLLIGLNVRSLSVYLNRSTCLSSIKSDLYYNQNKCCHFSLSDPVMQVCND